MIRSKKSVIAVLIVVTVAIGAHPAPRQGVSPAVVRYHATIDDVKYTYCTAPPAARLQPGNILESNSLDCFGNALQKPGDSFSLVKGDNPLTGPFYIEGAQPGDTLIVRILDLRQDTWTILKRPRVR